MIPVACVGVHYKFGPRLLIFTRALAQFRVWAAWLHWQELPLCRTLTMAPLGPAGCLRAYQLPMNVGGCPLWHCPPSDAHVACWYPGSLSEGRPCPLHCPRGILALRVPFRGSPVPSTLYRSLGPLAYSGRLVRCPGCPLNNTHHSTATLPAGP